MFRKLLSAFAAGGVLVGLLAVPATADPVNAKGSISMPMSCENGQTYQVVINGDAPFVPAHVIGSNTTFVPVAFGAITRTLVPSGVPLPTVPPRTKGESVSTPNPLITCSFDVIFPIPPAAVAYLGLPADTTGQENVGTVIGFLTPASE